MHELIVFGEVLYDCFSDGRRVLGGAPFNVAWGLKGLGYDPLFVSAVGEDADGRSIRKAMSSWGLSMDGLQTHTKLKTGDVLIKLQNGDASYEICAPRAWDAIEDEGHVCTGFLYHGLLALRDEYTRKTFEALVERSSAQRFFDINLRPPFNSLELVRRWAQGVDWLKLNHEELAVILGVDAVEFSAAREAVEQLRETYSVSNVLLTGGSEGAMIVSDYGEAFCSPAPQPEQLVDTVGAGDSFSAYTLHGLICGMSIETILTGASRFAAKVCAMRGATSCEPDFYR